MTFIHLPPRGTTQYHSYRTKLKWNLTKPLDLTSNLFPSMQRDQTICEKTSQGYNQQNSDHEEFNMTNNLIYSTTKITSTAGKKKGGAGRT